MELRDYNKLAQRTERTAEDYENLGYRVSDEDTGRLLHGVVGLSGEAGELLDIVKKVAFYGKPLSPKDVGNLAEEVGDCYWYLSLLCRVLEERHGITESQILKHNIEKLSRRYPERYSDTDAVDRVDKEQGTLEL